MFSQTGLYFQFNLQYISSGILGLLSKENRVFCGPRIQPGEQEAMENLARYIIRASFSQERMTYFPEDSKVVYRSKDGKEEKIFDALEWLAAMCSHVPNKGEQMVGYYGYYSNVSRGKRKKQNADEWIPFILESDESSKESRKNWSRLIQKIYEVDPLICPKCSGKMKVISVIEDSEIVKKIVKHLGLWDQKARPPPNANAPPNAQEYHIDYTDSQVPVPDNPSRASRLKHWPPACLTRDGLP